MFALVRRKHIVVPSPPNAQTLAIWARLANPAQNFYDCFLNISPWPPSLKTLFKASELALAGANGKDEGPPKKRRPGRPRKRLGLG